MVFYPTLTKFWIILILKSSEEVALIRWLKWAKSILMASKGQERQWKCGISNYNDLWLLSKKKYIFQDDGNMSQTQTLQLQYLYTLNLHLMKVLSLLLFTERLYKAQLVWAYQLIFFLSLSFSY